MNNGLIQLLPELFPPPPLQTLTGSKYPRDIGQTKTEMPQLRL
jgi:hypothetical protein